VNNNKLLGGGFFSFLLYINPSTALSAEPDLDAMWGKPLPEGCIVVDSDLRFPKFPADTNRGIRMVYAKGDYIVALSVGTANEYLSMLGQSAVTNELRRVVWGEDCKVDIEFVFLSASDELANIEEHGLEWEIEDSEQDDSTAVGSNASGQIVQNDSSQNSSDRSAQTNLASQTKNQNSVESPDQSSSRDDTNCDPPTGSVNKVVVPKVKFLISGCIDNSSSCASDSRVGECATACKQYQEPAVEGWAPEEKSTVGILLPDGEKIEWGHGIAESGTLTRTNPAYTGDDDIGPELILFSLSNGVQVTLDKEFGYSTSIPVSMLPFWSNSVVTTTAEPEVDELSATLEVDEKTDFNHLYFHKDGGNFKIVINNTTDTKFDENRSTSLPAECVKSANVSYEVKVIRDLTESTAGDADGNKVPEFFTGLGDTVSGILAPGEAVNLEAQLTAFEEQIKQFEFDHDLLYGAEIQIKVTREENGSELHNQTFSVYRYVDVADAHHEDNQIDFGKTLTDGKGPETVVRHRFAKFLVAHNSKLTFNLKSDSDFKVEDKGLESEFQFDPTQSDETVRKHVEEQLRLVHTKDNRPVADINLRGQTQPISYIVFNEASFQYIMSEIIRHAEQKSFAQAGASRTFIHPALVTNSERAYFDTEAKRQALTDRLKDKMMELWGSELNPYIKWAATPHASNGVELDWRIKDNSKKGPFAYGLTPNDQWGEGTDGFRDIQNLFAEADGTPKTDLGMNRAELVYRLNLAINHNLRKSVALWPDSILENHPGEIGPGGTQFSGASLTQAQFVDAMAKTAVHESTHSMGLNHVAQSSIDWREGGVYGYQLLEFSNAIYSDRSVTLTIDGENVDVPLWESHTQKLTAATFSTLINSLPSVGVRNYSDGELGAEVTACTTLGPHDPPCPASPKPDDQRFLVRWNGHLGAYDMETPALSAGLVVKIRSTSAKRVLRRNNTAGGCKQAVVDIPGIDRQVVFADIMHGGVNDVNGVTRFRSGVSLEPVKLALGINYSKEDIDKIINLFKSKIQTYHEYGSVSFESRKPIVAVPATATTPAIPAKPGTAACATGSPFIHSNPRP